MTKKICSIFIIMTLIMTSMPFALPQAVAETTGTLFYSSFENELLTNETSLQPLSGVYETNYASGVIPTANVESLYSNITNLVNSVTGNKPYNTTEVLNNLKDNNSSTKYLTATDFPVYINYKLSQAAKVTRYSITSANDSSDRDPKNWLFEGSNNGTDWVTLDTVENVEFSSRLETKYFLIDNSVQYSNYRLQITKRFGIMPSNETSGLVQIADLQIYCNSSIDISTLSKGLKAEKLYGPTDNVAGKQNAGWTGSFALKVSGTHEALGEAYSNAVIYDNLSIPVTTNTNLSYMIFPDCTTSTFDYSYTSHYMSIDLEFTDGTYLRNLGALDENGHALTPKAQGDTQSLYYRQWNNIYSCIGDVANGKTIKKILVVYDKPDNGTDILTYFDDIKITNKTSKVYNSLVDYVETTRGTQNGDISAGTVTRGLLSPYISVPNGFNFWTPFTGTGRKIYDYQTSKIVQFGSSHQSSFHLIDHGVFAFMPNTTVSSPSVYNLSAAKRAADFDHDTETACANYYAVTFNNDTAASGVKVEMSPTDHAVIVKFTFPKNSNNVNVIMDSICDNMTVNGSISFSGNSFRAVTDYKSETWTAGATNMYVYGEFSVTPTNTTVMSSTGRPLSVATFASGTTEVVLKMATSYMGYSQAEKNLNLEISSSDTLESVKTRTAKLWNDILSTVQVEGASETELITLYSNMYRMYIFPTNYSENTGTATNPKIQYVSPYKSTDNKVVIMDGQLYTSNGFWDTYRTAWPAYALLTPSRDTKYLNGILQHYIDSGGIGRWLNPGAVDCMTGSSYDVVFADAYSKGVTFDVKTAYEACIKSASQYYDGALGRYKTNTSVHNGYTIGSIDWTMQNSISDSAVATLCKAVGNLNLYGYYLRRSLNYANVFNSAIGFFIAKDETGKFIVGNSSFDPVKWDYSYVETNGWGTAFSVTHDANGLANLYGGKEALAEKLDELFAATSKQYRSSGTVQHEMTEASDLRLGQYQHSNQPSHHIIYMYDYAGQAYKTQYYTRNVLDRLYVGASIGQGYVGDDDNGEQSAWYVLSAIGFYPMNVGSDEYCITSPLYDKTTLHLESGNVEIVANNNSSKNIYIQSMTIDGKAYNKCFITQSDLIKAKKIVFNMGSTPSNWGCADDSVPSSITTGDNTPDVMTDYTSNLKFLQSGTGDAASYSCNNITNETKLINNNMSDWATFSSNTTTIDFDLKLCKAVDYYTIATGDDVTAAPNTLVLYGSNDGVNYVELNRSTVNFQWPEYVQAFKNDNNNYYRYYRLVCTGSKNLQISEVELLGDVVKNYTKEELKSFIDSSSKINTSTCTAELKQELKSQLENATSVYNNADATTNQITDAYNLLQSVVNEITKIDYGDINGDKLITAQDALLVLQYSVSKIDLSSKQIAAADVNGSCSVTAADALLILQYSVGKISIFPVEE